MLNRFTLAVCGSLLVTAATLADSNYEQVVASLDPIHWWRFNDALSSPTADDSVGNLNGHWHNGPNLTQGICDPDDPAIYFWNSQGPSHLKYNHSDSLLLTEGTISFCFIDTGKVLESGILSKDSEGFDNGGHLTIGTLPGNSPDKGSLYVRLQDEDSSHKVTLDHIKINTKYHLTFTFGPTGMKLYIDGELVDQNNYKGGLLNNYEPLVLGASTAYSGDGTHLPLKHFWSGILDELTIFNYAMTAEQVCDFYDQRIPPQIPEPASMVLLAAGAALLTRRRHRG